jgi:hypothetical protein
MWLKKLAPATGFWGAPPPKLLFWQLSIFLTIFPDKKLFFYNYFDHKWSLNVLKSKQVPSKFLGLTGKHIHEQERVRASPVHQRKHEKERARVSIILNNIHESERFNFAFTIKYNLKYNRACKTIKNIFNFVCYYSYSDHTVTCVPHKSPV